MIKENLRQEGNDGEFHGVSDDGNHDQLMEYGDDRKFDGVH